MLISVVNQKGGVAKTTTTTSLAYWFAMQGRRVLLVDMDVQGHAAACLGKPKGNGLFRLLVSEEPVEQVTVPARPNLDLVNSSKDTEKIKVYLADQVARELCISHALEQAAQQYDLILLDLAPGSDLLHIGSLVASDMYLVPAKMDYLALDGVVEVSRTVQSLSRIPNVIPPELVGVLPTLYDRTTTETTANLQRLKDAVGEMFVLPPIPSDTHMREATSRGLTIWEYAPESPAAVGYHEAQGEYRNSKGNLGGYLHLAEIIEDRLW